MTAALLLMPLGTQVAAADNGVYITQVGDAVAASPAGGSASAVTQAGERNYGQVDQKSAGQIGVVTQTGIENSATLSQSGGIEGNLALILQNGIGNQTTLEQNANALSNNATIVQNGAGNVASLAQNGDQNSALMVQNGDNNLMQVAQNGDNNNIVWTQTGSNLAQPKVEMVGNQTLSIHQLGFK